MTATRRFNRRLLIVTAMAAAAIAAVLLLTAARQDRPAPAPQLVALDGSGGASAVIDPSAVAEEFHQTRGLVRTDQLAGTLPGGTQFAYVQEAPTAAALRGHDGDGNETAGAPNDYASASTLTVRSPARDADLTAALRLITGDRRLTVTGPRVVSPEVVVREIRRSADETLFVGVFPAAMCKLPADRLSAAQQAACAR